jgi:hypothetical protein
VLYLKTNNDWINTLIFTVSLISIQGLRIEYHSTLTTEDIDPEMAVQNFGEQENQFCRHLPKRTHSKLCDKCDDYELFLTINTRNSGTNMSAFLHPFQSDDYLSGGQLSTQTARSSTTLTQAEHWSGPGPVQPPRHSSWQLFLLFLTFWQTPALQHLEFSQLAGQLGHNGPSLLLVATGSPL